MVLHYECELLLGKGPAEKTRAEKLPKPAPAPEPASDDDWIPPPHAVPFGPFLALGALEYLLAGPLLFSAFYSLLNRLLS